MDRYLLIPILEDGTELMGSFEFAPGEEIETAKSILSNYNKTLIQLIEPKVIVGFSVYKKSLSWVEAKEYYKVRFDGKNFTIKKCDSFPTEKNYSFEKEET